MCFLSTYVREREKEINRRKEVKIDEEIRDKGR